MFCKFVLYLNFSFVFFFSTVFLYVSWFSFLISVKATGTEIDVKTVRVYFSVLLKPSDNTESFKTQMCWSQSLK